MHTITHLNHIAEARRLALIGDTRAIRLAAGLSVREVADALAVSESCIRRWEAGQRSPRSGNAVRYLAVLSGLSGMVPRERCTTEGCDFRAEPGGLSCWACRADAARGLTPTAEAYLAYVRGEAVPERPTP